MRVLMLWALSLCLLTTARATDYYFSSNSGDDSHSATQAQNPSTPWKSINKLNAIFSTLKPGDAIFFKRGETFYGTIMVTASGTSSAPITIGAYGSGSEPVITGFEKLTNWTSVGSGRYESYDASLGSKVNMVTLNGEIQELGRYPNSNATNKGYLMIESHGLNTLTDDELPSSPNWTGAEVVVRTSHWTLDRMKVLAHVGRTLTFGTGATYPIKDNYGYFLQNDVRTLDLQGEWAYKASTKELTMHFGSSTPSSSSVKASVLSNLLYIYGKSYIVVENLSFEGANEDALYIYSSTGTKVRNCNILHSGINAIKAQNTNGLVVENSNISNTNNIAIYLVGGTNSSIIRNNAIKNTGMFAGMGQNSANTSLALRINGNKNLVEYNTIDNSGYCGIRFTGDYTVMKNNFITNFASVKDDGAGIYTGSPDGSEAYGRKIIGNIILNGIGAKEGTPGGEGNAVQQVSGIYMDNYSAGIEIRGNTVANCGKMGIFVHNAFKLTIRDNTFYNNTQGQVQLVHDHSASRITNVVMKNNIFVAKTAKQTIGYFYTNLGSSDITSFGTIDSNYYARPIDDNTTLRSVTGLYTSTQKITNHTLATWKPAYGHDDYSKKSPKTISATADPDDYLRLVYNASTSSKTISLGGTYIDMKNKTYSGSIALAPYASALLLKTADGPAPEDNQAPVVAIITPEEEDSYSAPASIRITATASDADGDINKVEFYRGSTLIGTESAAPYEMTWSDAAAGTYTLTAKAYDNSGNVTTSEPVIITVKEASNEDPDVIIPPVIAITSPGPDAIFTAPATVRIKTTINDADVSIKKVEIYNGSTLMRTENYAPYEMTWSNVVAGTYTITAKAYDNSGNVTTSAPVTITVKEATDEEQDPNGNQAPSIAIINPETSITLNAPASLKVVATASDEDGAINKVEFYRGTTLVATEKVAPYRYSMDNVLAGTYTITAKAYDNSGGVTTSAPVTITVQSSNLALASVEANDLMMSAAPSSSASLRLYPNPAVNSIFVDYGSLANNQKANLTIRNAAGSVVKSMQVTLSGNGTEVDISSLNPGSYVLSVTAEGLSKTQKFLKGN